MHAYIYRRRLVERIGETFETSKKLGRYVARSVAHEGTFR